MLGFWTAKLHASGVGTSLAGLTPRRGLNEIEGRDCGLPAPLRRNLPFPHSISRSGRVGLRPHREPIGAVMSTRSIPHVRSPNTAIADRDHLLKQAFKMVCVGGLDGYLKQVNETASKAFGYSQQELMAMPMIDLVHPEDQPRMMELLGQFAGGEVAQGVEVRIRAKDGTDKWVLWEAVPCVEEDVFLATGQDITQRKIVEDELRESQQRFQLLADATDEAVWDWDLRTDQLWRNDAYRRASGFPTTAEVGTIEWWRRRIHPDDVERVLQRFLRRWSTASSSGCSNTGCGASMAATPRLRPRLRDLRPRRQAGADGRLDHRHHRA